MTLERHNSVQRNTLIAKTIPVNCTVRKKYVS